MSIATPPAIALAVCALLAPGDRGAPPPDPNPPVVHERIDQASPRAERVHGLTTHRALRPLAKDAVIEDWPCFLGPRRDGTCRETHVALRFDADGPDLLWELERGQGYASPVVAGERVVFTHREQDQTHIDALSLSTGERFWRVSRPCAYRGEYIEDSGPRATPAISGDSVYVHSVDGRLLALDLSTGQLRWERDLVADFEVPDSFFGVVSSPLVYRDLLIVNLGAPGGRGVVAFTRADGRLAWQAEDEWGASCASPVVAPIRGEDRLLVITGGKTRPPTGGLVVLDPRTGAIALRHPFRSKTFTSVNGASPLAVGDGVFLTATYGVGSAFLDIGADGGYTTRWTNRRFGLQFGNPVEMDGRVIAVDGVSGRAGAIVGIDPASGDVEFRTDIDVPATFGAGKSTREISMSIGEGSLLRVGRRVLCLGDTGLLIVAEIGADAAEVIASSPLFYAADTWAPPVVSHGVLLVCQNKPSHLGGAPRRLLAYDLRGE